MYYNVVESNLEVMKLSRRRIIFPRALYHPARQSVIGYTWRAHAGNIYGVVLLAGTLRRCAARDIPGYV